MCTVCSGGHELAHGMLSGTEAIMLCGSRWYLHRELRRDYKKQTMTVLQDDEFSHPDFLVRKARHSMR